MPESLFSRIADLEVQIDGVRRHQLTFPTARWERISTVVVLTGGGIEGRGEDVSYDPRDQHTHVATEPPLLEGRRPIGEWSEMLNLAALVRHPLINPETADYRRWSYEGALLDLALRQDGRSLSQVLGRGARPVRFCVSPPGDPVTLRAAYPDRELKVDASVDWSDEYMEQLAATGKVRVVDMKAHYVGDWIKRPEDPLAFSRRVASAFPDAILEDPAIGEYMSPFHAEYVQRMSFDAPVHSWEDLAALPDTAWCNIKPSRFGTLQRLFDCVDQCEARGIRLYGGGQFEIGPGRAQIQALASVLYPDAPNDVAPSIYNAASLPDHLPDSPLAPTTTVGFAPAVEGHPLDGPSSRLGGDDVAG